MGVLDLGGGGGGVLVGVERFIFGFDLRFRVEGSEWRLPPESYLGLWLGNWVPYAG